LWADWVFERELSLTTDVQLGRHIKNVNSDPIVSVAGEHGPTEVAIVALNVGIKISHDILKIEHRFC